MPKRGYTAEQMINKLREVEVCTAKRTTIESAIRTLGVTRNTFYRWGKEYGGLRVDQGGLVQRMSNSNSNATVAARTPGGAASVTGLAQGGSNNATDSNRVTSEHCKDE